MRIAPVILAILVATTILPPAALGAADTYKPGDIYGSIRLRGLLQDLAWDPIGGRLAIALADSHEIRLYDVNGYLLWSLNTGKDPSALAWSPDGRLLAVGVSDELWIVESADGSQVYRAPQYALVTDVAWNPGGDVVAVATVKGTVILYDASGTQLSELKNFSSPITSIAWARGGQVLLVGGGNGTVYSVILSNSSIQSLRVDGVPVGFAPNPEDPREFIIATNMTIYKARLEANGTIVLEGELSYAAVSTPAWSPDGSTIAIPGGDVVAFFDADLNPIALVQRPGVYLFEHVAWNPQVYGILIAGGKNTAATGSSYYYIFTGSHYVLKAAPPVHAFCYAGSCSSELEVDAWNETTTVKVIVELERFGDQQDNITVQLHLRGEPMRTYTITGREVLDGSAGPLTIPGGESLIVVLRSEETEVVLENATGAVHRLAGLGVITPPGKYKVKLSLPKPENWLGPDKALEREVEVDIGPGEATVLNYTDFNLQAITARLVLDVEPGTTISLHYSNETLQTVAGASNASYTVPIGSYIIELALPVADNVIVESLDILVKKVPVRLEPGDIITLSFKYSDVLGIIGIYAPPGVNVTIVPPWQTSPAWSKSYAAGGRDVLLAEPGVYKLVALLSPPDNWLGPEPPVYMANITVDAGRRAEVNLYHSPGVREWLDIISRSATLTIESPEGYKIIVKTWDNRTVELESGSITLIAPPGNYTFQLIDPAKNALLAEEKLEVWGPGNYTVILKPPSQGSEYQPPSVIEPPSRGKRIVLAIIAAIIPLVAAAAAILYLRRRRAAQPQPASEIMW